MYNITYMWNLKKTQPTSEQNKKEANSHIYIYRERTNLWSPVGRGEWEGQHTGWGSKGVLLCDYVKSCV